MHRGRVLKHVGVDSRWELEVLFSGDSLVREADWAAGNTQVLAVVVRVLG